MNAPRVLVVDAEDLIRWSLRRRLTRDGCAVIEAATAAEGLLRIDPEIDLVLLDAGVAGHGLEILRRIRELAPDTPVILMTSARVEHASEAMTLGAFTCLHKPLDADNVAATVEQGLETSRLCRQVRALRSNKVREYGLDAIIGASPAIAAAKALLAGAANVPASPVLLIGETGTEKDLAARVIHYNSPRAAQPFVPITCSASSEAALERELFGDERAAYSRARHQTRGLFESADGGTAFLDEIGELPPDLQARLLRFLEARTFSRVGGAQEVRVDVRVVAATARDFVRDVDTGRFGEALVQRLQATAIVLPPLRERVGDIPLLANHEVNRYNVELHKRARGLTPEAMTLLEQYPWPGNVRELRNAIERAMLLLKGDWIRVEDIAPILRAGSLPPFRLPADGVDLEDVERQLLVQALERAGGNQTRAGRLLGINRDQVRYRVEKFDLALPRPAAVGA